MNKINFFKESYFIQSPYRYFVGKTKEKALS